MHYSAPESKSLVSDLQALKREKIAMAAKAFAKAKAEGTIRVVDPQRLHLVTTA
ncbi:hypothetical protein PS634_00908 [Pseudomonas fluorescens]|nr:hypothetical protein PS634_00908 [Pseudomonas fluorescens]